jgi:hypothetical protein
MNQASPAQYSTLQPDHESFLSVVGSLETYTHIEITFLLLRSSLFLYVPTSQMYFLDKDHL